MKITRLFAGVFIIGLFAMAGCMWEGSYRSTYAVTPDGEIYEVDPYYNDMTVWVNADEGQRVRIHNILVETRNDVIIDRRNAHSDREFHRLAQERYNRANTRIEAVYSPEQNRAFAPHRTELRNWVHGQRERPAHNAPQHGNH